MKKFTFKTLVIASALLFFIGNASGQEWNISSEAFNALGEMTSKVTVDGLTIYATADKPVTVDANNKTLEGMDFTHRLKLGGSGSFNDVGLPLARVLSFKIKGNTTITIMGMSSSSSADRELIVAVDSMNKELGRFPALGASISKGEFNFVGDSATIYLFSPSSGVNIYYLNASPTIAAERTWNISAEAFNALGEIATTKTVEGLTIHSLTDKTVIVDANNKTLDDMEFTHRLKLGGSGGFDEKGQPLSRVVSFEVKGNTKITVAAMSSSSSADRILNIAIDSMNGKFAEFPALGASLTKGVYNYTGGPGKILLFSPSSGVNIYYIKAEALATSINQIDLDKPEVKIYPNPATDKIYVEYGKPIQVAVYNIAGSLLKSKLIQSKYDYISIGDLQPGIYLVRSQNDKTFTKKLIKK